MNASIIKITKNKNFLDFDTNLCYRLQNGAMLVQYKHVDVYTNVPYTARKPGPGPAPN